MDAANTCKYYVTKLLRISPPKPNCVYDVRSGNVRDREQKSLLRVFYRSKGRRRRKHRHRAAAANGGFEGDGDGETDDAAARPVAGSYVPSAHADEAGARIGDGCSGGGRRGHALEDDTVEDIEKKFLGFRNVFEKCKVKKKKKPPRLFGVTSGLRFTLVANTMLHMDDPKGAGDETAASAAVADHRAGGRVAVAGGEADDGAEEEDDDGDGGEEEDDEDEEDEEFGGGGGGGGESGHDGADDTSDGDDDDSVYEEVAVDSPRPAAVVAGSGAADYEVETSEARNKCPKDVADKVNSWIDSSAKQTEYSEEESIFVGDEKTQSHGAVLKCGDRLHIVKGEAL